MQLIVAEKNSVGSTIASVIGGMTKKDGYYEGSSHIVTWCVGHIVDLDEPKAYGDKLTLPIIPDNWVFKVLDGKEKQFGIIKKLMLDSRVDEIVCATDAAREGECIFRYIYNYINCKKPYKRLWTSSLEESAIKTGLANLKDSSEYDNLFRAGFARAKADWLVGMNFSRHYTALYNYPENPITHKKALNYGRVMTPVLQMIIDRDYKVNNFVKEKYYTVELNCGNFVASSERIDSKDNAENIMTGCNGASAEVKSVKRETKNQKPPKLYDLTTLQREANRKFGYTAVQTLDYTQSLYENKLVTYPRTDSCYITDDMENTANEIFHIVCECIPFAQDIDFTPNIGQVINNAKVSDHHALLPTKLLKDKNIKDIPENERNILFLICARLLCAVSDKYTYETVSAVINCNDTDFKVTGRTDIERGWKNIYDEIQKGLNGEKDEPDNNDKTVPDLSEGMTFDNVSSELSEHWTSPPKLFTEDTLLSAMETAGNNLYEIESDIEIEKKGLGTPATRAAAIEKLVTTGYIERKKKLLIPTEFGKKVIMVTDDRIKTPMLTVEWETKLQKIEHGEYSDNSFMQEISEYVSDIVASDNTVPDEYKALFPKPEQKSFGKCPKCGGNVYSGKFGYYCENSAGSNKTCKFSIKNEDNFFKWKGISPTDKMVSELLKDGKSFVKGMTSMNGNKFDGYVVLDSSDEYARLKTEIDKSQSEKEFCKCPKCGGTVVEDKFSYHCENSKGANKTCNVYLKKEDNFFLWKGTTLKSKAAKELLTNGKTKMTGLKSKSGSTYNADIILDTSGQYVQYQMEFEPKKK